MISVDMAVEQFLDACRADGLKGPTVRWYEGKLRPFKDEFGDLWLPNVQVSDMREYVRGLYARKIRYVGVKKKKPVAGALSVESIRGHIRTLKRFFRWCYEEYALMPADNPMRGIKTPRAPKPVPKEAKPETIRALLDACDISTVIGLRDCALIAFLADTGCRLKGALGLRVSTIDLDARRAQVFEKYDKGRIVAFSHYTAQQLNAWLFVRPKSITDNVFLSLGTNTYGAPLTISGVHAMLKRLAVKAGVADDRFNPHSFRHGLAHMWIDAGGDASRLAEIMGHSGVAITLSVYGAYLHAQALEKFDELALMDKLMRKDKS